jgi:hypothetical protein
MKIKISTQFNCSSEKVLQKIQKPKLLIFVMKPWLVVAPFEPKVFPDIWEEKKYVCSIKLFGYLPLVRQAVVITKEEVNQKDGIYKFKDNGYSIKPNFIKKWEHIIYIKRINDKLSQYTDEIDIKAGILTPLVWFFSILIYLHRQRNWKKLIKNNFDYQSCPKFF